MKALVLGTAVALVVGAITTTSGTATGESERWVTGDVERVIQEAPHWGTDATHEGPAVPGASQVGDDHSSEHVFLVTDDNESVELPPDLAGDLSTGTRVRVRVAGSLQEPRALRDLEVLTLPSDRNSGRPERMTQALPYALVQLNTPESVPGAATTSEVAGWLNNIVEPFYQAQAPGAFDFSVHSQHVLDWTDPICGQENSTVRKIKERLGIPDDVGLVVITYRGSQRCPYVGLALLYAGWPGGWVMIESRTGGGGSLLTHEIGHNLELRHPPRWICDSGSNPLAPGAAGCVLEPYGVGFNPMGAGAVSGRSSDIEAFQRWQLGSYAGTQLMSVPSESGSALIQDSRQPLLAVDGGEPRVYQGERVIRALHLRDTIGEAWIVARTSPLTQGGSGVTVSYRTDWGESVSTAQREAVVQLDLVNAPPGSEKYAATPALYDLALTGQSVTTPGGTTLTVGASVDTPYGKTIRVSWQGTQPTPTMPGVPEVVQSNGQKYLASGCRPAPGAHVALQGIEGEFQECSVIDASGITRASWRAVSVLPVPGPEWRGTSAGERPFHAWSPEANAVHAASWRFPLLGDAPRNGVPRPLGVAGPSSTLRTRCVNAAGSSVESSTVTVRVDAKPPTVAQGSFEIQGLNYGQVYVESGIKDARPPLRVGLPSYADAESGLSRRQLPCPTSPPGEPRICLVWVPIGKGSVSSSATDAVGNVSAVESLNYEIVPVRAVRAPNTQWAQVPTGFQPTAAGSSTTVKVRGREVGVVARCGRGTGTIQVHVNGKALAPADVGSDTDPFFCTVRIADLTKKVNRVKITYVSLGSGTPGSDVLVGLTVLR